MSNSMSSRRDFFKRSVVLAAAGAGVAKASRVEDFKIVKSEQEWLEQLGEDRFRILRKEATERPGTSALLNEKRKGTYHCAGCDLPVYESVTKFDSGTGWPSFYDAMPNAIGTREDRKLIFSVRTEIHCSRCGGHFGHVFDDGPAPTGKRHCLNGLSLVFKPDET